MVAFFFLEPGIFFLLFCSSSSICFFPKVSSHPSTFPHLCPTSPPVAKPYANGIPLHFFSPKINSATTQKSFSSSLLTDLFFLSSQDLQFIHPLLSSTVTTATIFFTRFPFLSLPNSNPHNTSSLPHFLLLLAYKFVATTDLLFLHRSKPPTRRKVHRCSSSASPPLPGASSPSSSSAGSPSSSGRAFSSATPRSPPSRQISSALPSTLPSPPDLLPSSSSTSSLFCRAQLHDKHPSRPPSSTARLFPPSPRQLPPRPATAPPLRPYRSPLLSTTSAQQQPRLLPRLPQQHFSSSTFPQQHSSSTPSPTAKQAAIHLLPHSRAVATVILLPQPPQQYSSSTTAAQQQHSSNTAATPLFLFSSNQQSFLRSKLGNEFSLPLPLLFSWMHV